MAKAWRYIPERGILLYKQGTQGFSNGGRESYIEYYAYLIGRKMGLDMVPYDLKNWEGRLSSVCPLFTSIETSYMPAGAMVKEGSIQAVARFYKELGPSYYEALASMLVFDALIYNEDRHFGNFGLLIDSRTNTWKGPAPLFDHGMSLLHFATTKNMKNYVSFKAYASTRRNPYGIPWLDLAAQFMGVRQKKQLEKLIGFKFPRNEIYGFPERKLRLLEHLLQDRLQELLALPTISPKQTGHKTGSLMAP